MQVEEFAEHPIGERHEKEKERTMTSMKKLEKQDGGGLTKVKKTNEFNMEV